MGIKKFNYILDLYNGIMRLRDIFIVNVIYRLVKLCDALVIYSSGTLRRGHRSRSILLVIKIGILHIYDGSFPLIFSAAAVHSCCGELHYCVVEENIDD